MHNLMQNHGSARVLPGAIAADSRFGCIPFRNSLLAARGGPLGLDQVGRTVIWDNASWGVWRRLSVPAACLSPLQSRISFSLSHQGRGVRARRSSSTGSGGARPASPTTGSRGAARPAATGCPDTSPSWRPPRARSPAGSAPHRSSSSTASRAGHWCLRARPPRVERRWS